MSNVLNHPHRVAPATRAAVLKVIEELGFTGTRWRARSRGARTRTVGLVVVDLSNSLFVDIARGAQRSAREQDRDLQLATAENDFALLEEHMAVMTGAHVPACSSRRWRTRARPSNGPGGPAVRWSCSTTTPPTTTPAAC